MNTYKNSFVDLPLRLLTALTDYSGDGPQFDDIGIMVLHMKEKQENG